ncbi:MAG: DUF4124 domain-containing protein [Colwellia sp.]
MAVLSFITLVGFMSIRLLIMSSVLFVTTAVAKDISIYRWVDENNVVHFSQQQPTAEGYSQLTTFSSYKAKTKKTNENPKFLTVQAKNQHDQMQKNDDIFKKNCQSAKLNLKMLNSFDKILVKDEEGNSTLLDNKQKKKQIEDNKKNIDLYCDKK